MNTSPSPAFLDLTADRIPLHSGKEIVGWAYGAENWMRAAAFICERGSRTAPPPHLRYWGLSVADLDSYDRQPSLADMAHGTSGNGGEE